MNNSQKVRIKELLTGMQLALEIHMSHCHSPLKEADRPDNIVHTYVDRIVAILDEPPRNRRASDAKEVE